MVVLLEPQARPDLLVLREQPDHKARKGLEVPPVFKVRLAHSADLPAPQVSPVLLVLKVLKDLLVSLVLKVVELRVHKVHPVLPELPAMRE
jgi:hypothetical protein